jgi:hypothetical protein
VLINAIDADVDVIGGSERSFSFEESNIYEDERLRRRQKKSHWDDIDVEKLRKKKSYWDDIDVEKLRKDSFEDDYIDSPIKRPNRSSSEKNFENRQAERTVSFNDKTFLPHYVESIQDAYDRNCHARLNIDKRFTKNANNCNIIFVNNEPARVAPFPMIMKNMPTTLFEIDEFLHKKSACF